MKRYLYFILIFFSDGLLRILYLEKTSFRDFGFQPFPLFIMLSYMLNMILSVSYVTSNSSKTGNSFVLSRFHSCRRCFVFICAGTLKGILFCSFVQSVIPAAFSLLGASSGDMGRTFMLAVMFFVRQTVLLCYGAFAALLIEITGTLVVLLFVIADSFMPWALALVDMSVGNCIVIAAEVIVFFTLLILYCFCFEKSKDKLDERL